jgi:phage terminase large subunit-like protein
MALANGIYLSSHNTFRGLPKGMIAGNFFRSILSIPVAILFNTIIGGILLFYNVPGVDAVLQKWAAIISKAASDMVAGLIEGTVDRFYNLDLRKRDIGKKFSDLFETYAKLELLFPETEELRILENPEKLFTSRNFEVRDLSVMIIINSLDLFYFWMYLPRARMTILDMVSRLTPEERTIFMQSQKILAQEQHISRLFVDGILGRNFSRPLSFYLTTYQSYLSAIEKINHRHDGI